MKVKALCLFTIVLCLFLGVSSCKRSQEQPKTTPEKKVEKEPVKKVRKKSQAPVLAESEEAAVKIIGGSGNVLGIELTNKVPVRAVQFTLEGVQINEVRSTPRTAGFLVDFNKESGKVIMLSTSGDTVSTGTGLIAEVVCDKKDSANLKVVKIIK